MKRKNTGRAGRRRKRILQSVLFFTLTVICVVLINFISGLSFDGFSLDASLKSPSREVLEIKPLKSPFLPEDIPDELVRLLELNRETYDFVTEYPNREQYLSREIDLSADREVMEALDAGDVPLLMQWDLRWGYAPYGEDMVGLAGCGPTCLSMAYLYLTGNTSMHPAAMAEFACDHGFYTAEYGTDWALWTDGAGLLGLYGEVLSLDESAMKDMLQKGGVIICSMRPGDFTTTGHFILIRGCDENGFFVNDPNRRSNSERQWTYEELRYQIKNLWGIW